jgi:hypothetical protein
VTADQERIDEVVAEEVLLLKADVEGWEPQVGPRVGASGGALEAGGRGGGGWRGGPLGGGAPGGV